MTKLPSLTGKQLITVLAKAGSKSSGPEAVIIFCATQTAEQP